MIILEDSINNYRYIQLLKCLLMMNNVHNIYIMVVHIGYYIEVS